MLPGHCVLGARLGDLDQVDETSLTFFEAANDSFLRELWEVVILDHKVVQIVSEVVGTSGSSVTVEDAEKADLGPLDV